MNEQQVRSSVASLSKSFGVEEPKEKIDELFEMVTEFRFHEYVQLVLLLTKPARERGSLEVDDELKADEEESTSEGEGDDDDENEDDEGDKKRVSDKMKERLSSRVDSLASPNSPSVQRIRSRLRAGSVRKDGLLHYVTFVTKKDTQDWFQSQCPVKDGFLTQTAARAFLESLATVLRLKDWKEPLDEFLEEVSEIRYFEFVQLFLAMSNASRECKDLRIDDDLAALDEASTSEASEDEEPEPVKMPEKKEPPKPAPTRPQKEVVHAWCPPFMPGQSTSITALTPELISSVLSFLSMKELVNSLTVCKAWAAAVKKHTPYQWTHEFLYYLTLEQIPEFQQRHKLLTHIKFMRQFNADLIEPVLRAFPSLESISLTCHAPPMHIVTMPALRSLQTEGRIPALFFKKLATSCQHSLTSLNLSRELTSDEERTIPGMAFLKEFGKLRELNLQGCKGEGLNYILQNCAMMRVLNLGFVSVTNIHCQLIGGNMFHLRTLVLRSTDVSDDGLYEIGLGCKKLEQVFLENCKRIGAQGVVDLIANCTQISALKLAGCSQLRDDTVFALSGAKNLQELDVQMLEQVTPKAWYILASKCVHIRIFHAWGCNLTEEVISKFHRRCIVYHALTARNTRAPTISTPDWKNMQKLRKKK